MGRFRSLVNPSTGFKGSNYLPPTLGSPLFVLNNHFDWALLRSEIAFTTGRVLKEISP